MLFYAYNYSYNPASTFAFFFPHLDFQLYPHTVTEFKLRSHGGKLVLILECKRLKKKRRRTEEAHSGPLPATIEMLNISMCVCVFY